MALTIAGLMRLAVAGGAVAFLGGCYYPSGYTGYGYGASSYGPSYAALYPAPPVFVGGGYWGGYGGGGYGHAGAWGDGWHDHPHPPLRGWNGGAGYRPSPPQGGWNGGHRGWNGGGGYRPPPQGGWGGGQGRSQFVPHMNQRGYSH